MELRIACSRNKSATPFVHDRVWKRTHLVGYFKWYFSWSGAVGFNIFFALYLYYKTLVRHRRWQLVHKIIL